MLKHACRKKYFMAEKKQFRNHFFKRATSCDHLINVDTETCRSPTISVICDSRNMEPTRRDMTMTTDQHGLFGPAQVTFLEDFWYLMADTSSTLAFLTATTDCPTLYSILSIISP